MSSIQEIATVVYSATTLMLIGLIWFVQVVHYPLFDKVGQPKFSEYEALHQTLTARVIGLPWLLQGVSLAILNPVTSDEISWWFTVPSWLAAVVILASTVFVQVPIHARLSSEFSQTLKKRLVKSNWIRTVAWSLQGLLCLGL